jgi:hypothetical protein
VRDRSVDDVRAQADALEIEALAKRRLADEYDAAQECGEVATSRDGRRRTKLALLWQNYSFRCFPPICLLQYGHR